MSLTHGWVLVTGASRGLGRAVAERLGDAGFDVVLWARDGDQLAEVARVLEKSGVQARLASVSVEDPASVAAAAAATLDDLPGLRGAVINAGRGAWRPVAQLGFADWRDTVGVNLDGAFLTVEAALPLLLRVPGSQLVALGSDATVHPFEGRAAYCASKAGLHALMEVVRRESRGRGLRVTSLLPSRVDTFFGGRQPGDRPDGLTTEEVAQVVGQLFVLPSRVEVRELHLAAITAPYGPFAERQERI